MYRSLLLQLLEGFPDLQTLLDDPELIPAQDQNACPSLNILKGLLHKAVSLLGQRSFTCFIDALDECDEQQLLDMIQYFEYLSEQSTAKCLRICFSSRHYPYIMIRHGARLTLEHQPGHTEDLQAYVGDNLRTEDSDIVQKLLQKSAGVFMWVVLVVEILNRELARGAMSLDRKLEDLPSGLSNLFKEILKRDDENMEGLLLCFLWILCAKRPLRPEEFYHALWSGLSLKSPSLVDTKIPDALVQDTSNGLPRSHRYVISCSKGLAEVTISGKPSVQFIHESVRDFLIKDRGLYELWPQLGLDWESPSHDRLKDCCNFYINHKDVCELAGKRPAYPEPYRTKDVTEASNHYPFLGYSSRNTLYHANAAAKVVSQDDFLSSFHVINWVGINNLFEKSQIRLYTPHASLLYILADKGYPDLIRTRLQKFPEIHIFGERYEYPLFSALACSDKASVAALLNLPSTIYDGIDITEGLNHRKDLKRYEKRTPLSWAAENGRAVLLKLLIERGADVNTVDRTGWTPLLYASREGNEAIAKLLVEQGADVNTVSSNGWTPLLLTSIFGYVAIARILIEQGATLNAISLRGETSLSFASREGYEAFSRLLIEHGADINGIDGSRPLFLALENRREAIARLLIEQGADIHATDRHRHTPLSLASREGNEAIAKLLIEQGATINATTLSGETSLSFASRKGHEAIARLLIQEGADVNAADLNGGTPLFLTLKNGHEAIARLLIEGGADVNATDSNGRTPLSEAFAGSYEALAKFLIEWGAYVNASDEHGWTALEWAS